MSEPLAIPERYKHAHSTLVGRRTKVCTLRLTWTDEQIISFIEEIARLEAEVKFLKSAPCPFEAEVAALKAQAEWTLIDTEHLPKVGDEVGGYDPALAIPSWRIRLVSVAFLADLDIPQWRRMGYTHYRPINAPQEPA